MHETGAAAASPQPCVGGRTPHLSFAVLVDAAPIVGVVLRVRNAEPAPAGHPLSAAPVDGVPGQTLR